MLLVEVFCRDFWFRVQVYLMKIIVFAFSDVSEWLIIFRSVSELLIIFRAVNE